MPHGKAVPLELSGIERGQLERLVRRHKTAQALALRARIILLAGDSLTNTAIAGRLGETCTGSADGASASLGCALTGYSMNRARERHARSAARRLQRRSGVRWKPDPKGRPTGACARWRR